MKQEISFEAVLLQPAICLRQVAFTVLINEPLILHRVFSPGFETWIYLN